jgi:hypothetical protein
VSTRTPEYRRANGIFGNFGLYAKGACTGVLLRTAVTSLGHRLPSRFGHPPLILWRAVTAFRDPLQIAGMAPFALQVTAGKPEMGPPCPISVVSLPALGPSSHEARVGAAIHRCLQAAFNQNCTPVSCRPTLFHCTIYILPFCKLWGIYLYTQSL